MQLVVSDGVLIAFLIVGVVSLAIYKEVPIKVWRTLHGFGVETAPNRSKPKPRRRQKSDDQP